MTFNTLESFDKELSDMEKTLKEMEEYLIDHPEKQGTQGNYETLKYVYNIFKNDKKRFIENISEIDLKLLKVNSDNMTVTEFSKLIDYFNKTQKNTPSILNSQKHDELLFKGISKGSCIIKFNFQNPTEEDVLRTSTRKKGLLKLFNLIDCGDNIDKLKNEAGLNGTEALTTYKKFLEEIVKHETDFTLSTEKGTLKTGLTLQQCKNICENLNI